MSRPIHEIKGLPMRPRNTSTNTTTTTRHKSISTILSPYTRPTIPTRRSPKSQSSTKMPLLYPRTKSANTLHSTNPSNKRVQTLPPIYLNRGTITTLNNTTKTNTSRQPTPTNIPTTTTLRQGLPMQVTFQSNNKISHSLRPTNL